MRIGIDARLAWRGLGIAQVITNLVKELAGRVEIVWFGDPALAPVPVPAVRVDRLPYPALDVDAARLLARRARVDVMHFLGNTGWPRAGSPPFVLTVQDLLFMDSSPSGRSLRQIVGHRYARRNVTRAVAAASAVATPSAASAQQLAARMEPRSAPVVIPYGFDHSLAPAPARGDPAYVIAFAGRDPRKRAELAVAGWRAAGGPEQLWLLAGGGLPAGLEDELGPDLAAGRVVLLPYLERTRLQQVIAGARALIYPSSGEGFGLPVLEAMASGVPVITGLAPATLEVGGDAVVRIAPQAPVETIAAGLRRLREDAPERARLIELGLARAAGYSWGRCADAYLELYARAAAA